MTITGDEHHPSLEKLLACAGKQLGAAEAEVVAAHLQDCALCRLEIKRFVRFNEMDTDSQAAQEAQWDRAELDLARSWREKIQPALAGDADAAAPRSAAPRSAGSRRARWWTIRRSVWFLPAAAAAALVMFALFPKQVSELPTLNDSPVLRGADADSVPQIVLEVPTQEQESCPELFKWASAQECDSYTLEIFTAKLQTVFLITELAQPQWTAGEDLCEKLEPGQVYLWHVRGYRQLAVVAESGESWFRFQ